ncbi:MAG: small-conductance mechanosensitive channel [Myxococcota bacterium]
MSSHQNNTPAPPRTIRTTDHFGTVEHVDLRATKLRTPQGELIVIPNRQVFNDALINYTETPERRVDIPLGVSYADDLAHARSVVIDALKQLEINADPERVQVVYTGFGGSSVDSGLRRSAARRPFASLPLVPRGGSLSDFSLDLEARFWVDTARQGAYLTA